MDRYSCRTATRDELLKRWEYLIGIHPGNDDWVRYSENALRNYDAGSVIPYLGFLDGESICEATAYVKESAFAGDIADPSGLLNDHMAYLAAFRTNKEYEGNGYFRILYDYMEKDLKERGYTELSLGVGPEAVRNIEIYFHLGFREYIKTVIERIPSKDEASKPEEDVILFYKKRI